ncbi:MAG: hypothetical protein AAF950_18415 [Pseudomonadota bacterium]
MTKRTKKGNNGEKMPFRVNPVGLHPRLVELVRFMARSAAEYDFKTMLEAQKDKEKKALRKEPLE